MSERKTKHDIFLIERKFPQSPTRVFNAFADPAAKARWFGGSPGQWTQTLREFDFRVGGREQGTRTLLERLAVSLGAETARGADAHP